MAKDYSCLWCKHINENLWQCKAFPARIPMRFVDGTDRHDEVLEGQGNEFVYEPNPKSPYFPAELKGGNK